MSPQTLRLRRAMEKLRRNLLVAAGLIVVASVAVAIWGPPGSVLSAVVGGGGSLIFMGFTWFSTAKMTSGETLGIGWLALDYFVKLLVSLGLMVFAKNSPVLLPVVVALLLVGGILANMLAQILAFADASQPSKKKD